MLEVAGGSERVHGPAYPGELAHLVHVLEKQPACLVRVGLDGVLLAVNEAALSLLAAKTLADVLDSSLVERFLPNQESLWREFAIRVWESGSGSVECDLVDSLGARRSVFLHALARRQNPDGIPSLFVTIRDISATRRLEETVEYAARVQDESQSTEIQLEITRAECERLRAAIAAVENDRDRLQEMVASAAARPTRDSALEAWYQHLDDSELQDLSVQVDSLGPGRGTPGERQWDERARAGVSPGNEPALDAATADLEQQLARAKQELDQVRDQLAAERLAAEETRDQAAAAREEDHRRLSQTFEQRLAAMVDENSRAHMERHERAVRDLRQELERQLQNSGAESLETIQRLGRELQQVREESARVEAQMQVARDAEARLRHDYEAALSSAADGGSHTAEALASELAEARRAHERLQGNYDELHARLQDHERQLEQVTREHQAREQQLSADHEGALTALREAAAAREQELESQLGEARQALEHLQREHEVARGERDHRAQLHAQALVQLQSSEEQLRKEHELTLTSLRDAVARREQELESQLGEARQALEHLQREHEVARGERDHHAQLHAQALVQLQSTEEQLRTEHELALSALRETDAAREQELESQLGEARQTLEHLHREYEAARAQRDQHAQLHAEALVQLQSTEEQLRTEHALALMSLREAVAGREQELESQLGQLRQAQEHLQREYEAARRERDDLAQLHSQAVGERQVVEEQLRKEHELALLSLQDSTRSREQELASQLGEARQAQERLQSGYEAARGECDRLAQLHSEHVIERQTFAERLRQEHELAVMSLRAASDAREQQLEAQLAEARQEQARVQHEYDAALVEFHTRPMTPPPTPGEQQAMNEQLRRAQELEIAERALSEALRQKDQAIRSLVDRCAELETFQESVVALSPLAVAGRVGRELGAELQQILVSLTARTRRVLTLTSLEASGREELESVRKEVLRAWILGQQLSDACRESRPDPAGRN